MNSNNQKIQARINQLLESEEENKNDLVNSLKMELKEYNPIKSKFLPVRLENQVVMIVVSDFKDVDQKVGRFLQSEFKKQVVDIGQLLEWSLNNNLQVGQRIAEQIEQKKIEYDQLYNNPKNKNKKGQNQIELSEFIKVSEEDFKALLQERIEAKDCRAGCVFINMQSSICSTNTILNALTSIYSPSKIVIVDIKKQNQEETEPEGMNSEE